MGLLTPTPKAPENTHRDRCEEAGLIKIAVGSHQTPLPLEERGCFEASERSWMGEPNSGGVGCGAQRGGAEGHTVGEGGEWGRRGRGLVGMTGPDPSRSLPWEAWEGAGPTRTSGLTCPGQGGGPSTSMLPPSFLGESILK